MKKETKNKCYHLSARTRQCRRLQPFKWIPESSTRSNFRLNSASCFDKDINALNANFIKNVEWYSNSIDMNSLENPPNSRIFKRNESVSIQRIQFNSKLKRSLRRNHAKLVGDFQFNWYILALSHSMHTLTKLAHNFPFGDLWTTNDSKKIGSNPYNPISNNNCQCFVVPLTLSNWKCQ